MTYATVMVHVGVEGDFEERAGIARSVAERFQARLIGIAGWAIRPALYYDGIASDVEPTDRLLREMESVLESRGALFRSAIGDAQAEWRSALDFPTEFVACESRTADIVVIGRDWKALDLYSSLDPGALLLKAGRPVLMVPPATKHLQAKRVLVAWKDCRESRRAVRDAMPFLKQAQHVFIAEVSEGSEATASQSRLSDVASYLERHHVPTVATRLLPLETTATSALLTLAQKEGADLIVAGAYGHSRLGEWIFGGVTRELLTGSPVCCLFSN